jgi:predicted PurR-regulated permease PerM
MRALLTVALLALVVFILFSAWTALVPFFLGLLVAYLLLPAVNFLDRHAPKFLRRHGWSRPLSIIIVYIVGTGIITGMISYFVPLVSQQAELLREATPTLWRRVEGLLAYDFDAQLERIPPQIRETLDANIATATRTLVSGIQKGLEVTLRTLSQTVSFILGLLIIPIWLFNVLNEQEKAKRHFFNLMPESIREDVRCIVTIIDDLMGAYLRGQLLLCVIVGALATIALIAFGIEAAVLLGTVAGLLEIVPILGPYLGALPAVLIALIKRPILALWVALSFAAIQQIENLFLVPRISGHAVRFHPAVVMVLVLVGSEIAGLWGLLVAVPLAAMIRDVFQYLFLRTTERGATPEMALESLRARTR